jgi:aspartyl-tRNA(Asn)/glutamyl-tRNA(Gln) amidotransferase subunit A
MVMVDADLHYMSLAELASAIRSREISPVEVATWLLDRIETLNPHLSVYFHVFAGDALSSAREAERELEQGHYRGPLHGVPIAIKDVIDCGPTTAGSLLRRDYRAPEDAVVISRLKQAGAIVIGKAAAFEFAFGTPDWTSAFPPTRNPWQLDFLPGGSSSGSAAAVTAGLAYGALGTDTGGSIRIPAFHCGVVGLQPTYGLVSRHGVVPLSWSKDHVGPLARSVEDVAILLQACAGYDSRDPASADVAIPDYLAGLGASAAGTKIGIPWGFFESSCQPEILEAFRLAVERMSALGAHVETAALDVTLRELSGNSYVTTWAEAAAYHMPDLRSRADQFGPELRLHLMYGASIGAAAYLQAQRFRRKLSDTLMALFGKYDVLMLPPTGSFPEVIPDRPRPISKWMGPEPPPTYAAVTNMARVPSISVPCGFSKSGLPIGFMFIAPPFHEARLLHVAHAYETAHSSKRRHPTFDSGGTGGDGLRRLRERPP